MKRAKPLLALLLAAGLALAGCTGEAEAPTLPAGEDASTADTAASTGEQATLPATVTDEDTNDAWDAATATTITLSDSGIAVSGDGKASADGSVVTIAGGGTYVLQGSLTDGQILVDAGKNDTVQLVLDGVDVTNTTGAPLYCPGAYKLIVTLAAGSQNTLADGVAFAYADTAEEEPDAALFCKNDLTINGSGSLAVNAVFRNGIGSKDHLIIVDGAYTITAANHGIRGRDSVTVLGGDFTINAGNDGIQANNDTDESRGWIRLEGGTYAITSGHDGMQAETALTITGGDYTVTSGGGHTATPAADPDDSTSYKGLKAGTSIVVSGGTLAIDSADDAVHSNGSVAVSGGSLTLSTGDDGIHADSDLTITDGDIAIPVCYEGLEGMTITLAGGSIDLTASDDGVNAAGGTDGNAGRFGPDRFAGMNEDGALADTAHWLRITGGSLTIRATGDGIDSNGNIEMSGGTVTVHGPTGGGDGALDYDGAFLLSGGTLVAAGSAGMAQAPGDASTQPSLLLYYSAPQAAGTTVELRDAAGGVLAAFTAEKEFQTILFSTPELADGETYTVATGDTTQAISLSGTVTAVSDTGEAVTAGMGGMGGRPGGGARPDGAARPNGGGRGMGQGGTPPDDAPPAGMPTGDIQPPAA